MLLIFTFYWAMIHFGAISVEEFLAEYWQKKPLLIKQALPDFISPLSPEELAGLSLEAEFESRLVQGDINTQQWSLKNGPFTEQTFAQLPEKNWTLLVQGVDRFIDEVHDLINHFDFIPRWRFDDVMMSYATTGGSVGPHFDYYDVFLLQSSGRRCWQLSSQHCELDNYLNNVPLRIMDKFEAEQTWDVEPGDVLYVPPKVAHHGVSLDDDCTTLSFGYRAYQGKEITDFLNIESSVDTYYQDPVWQMQNTPALIPASTIQQANKITKITANEFAAFTTQLDSVDTQILQNFMLDMQHATFNQNKSYDLHPVCKIAYLLDKNSATVFLNGEILGVHINHVQTIIDFCNTRSIVPKTLDKKALALYLFDLGVLSKKS